MTTTRKKKLTTAQLRLLHLVKRDEGSYGWVNVSDLVWPLVQKLPADLVELGDATYRVYRVRLTEGGKAIVKYM